MLTSRLYPFILLLLASTAWSDELMGIVVAVHDGDTITVLDAIKTQHKIRLAGIDAPELGQAYGKASRDNLAQHVAGKQVSVDWYKFDKYQRMIGTVLLEGKDQNIEQVRAGLAWHYKKYQGEQTPEVREAYAQAEQTARASRTGLWRENEPIAPWEWRATQKKPQTP